MPGPLGWSQTKTAHAKAQRSAKEKSLLFFANFADFAALRETGLLHTG
jgi:hypothetical protein